MRYNFLISTFLALAAHSPAYSKSTGLTAPQWLKNHSDALRRSYPSDDLRKDRSAAAMVKLVVATNGKVLSCQLIEQIGNAALASKICGLMKRFKLAPARLANGSSVLGVTTTLVRFCVPGSPEGDMVCAASQAPDATAKSATVGQSIDVKVVLHIGSDGKPGQCAVYSAEQVAMTDEVCRLAAKLPFGVESGENGLPTTYVTDRTILLMAAK